jgi:hypothetical protein
MTMDDLSHMLSDDPVNVMVPTSQSGGNRAHSNERAMTAPGGVPANMPATFFGNPTEFNAPDVDDIETQARPGVKARPGARSIGGSSGPPGG